MVLKQGAEGVGDVMTLDRAKLLVDAVNQRNMNHLQSPSAYSD